VNVLKAHLRITIDTLHWNGTPHREIQRRTGVDRKTIRRYARQTEPNSPGVATGFGEGDPQNPPPRPPAPRPALVGTISACEPHRMWIEAQVALGRNAGSIYQDLVEAHGFTHQY
jgi:hypothetical protein